MTPNLPNPVAAYFAANPSDTVAIARLFTDNANVMDEGHAYNGLAAIKEWKSRAAKKYTYTLDPFASEEVKGRTIVTSRVAGNFPGSPVDLRFAFQLEGDKIASLEIAP